MEQATDQTINCATRLERVVDHCTRAWSVLVSMRNLDRSRGLIAIVRELALVHFDRQMSNA